MKKFILPLLLLLCVSAGAQYNNSWIDYSKTYYKFHVGEDGVYRISQSSLQTAGIATTNADHYQIWRNGAQVALYTSSAGAPLPTGGYIEFWGRANDGKPDTKLYNNDALQLTDKYSMNTDTAAYFLTVNTTASANLRLTAANNPAPGGASPDLYFMREVTENYKTKVNNGKAIFAGELVYASSYDAGEGWSSADLSNGAEGITTFNNLNVYTAGPANSVTVKATAASNASSSRTMRLRLNGDSIAAQGLPQYEIGRMEKSGLALTRLTNPASATVGVAGVGSGVLTTNRIVMGTVSITYPATFNFNNAKTFEFKLQPSSTGNFLRIDNFDFGATQPVLYDLAAGLRYMGDITATPGKVQFVLPASTVAKDYILASLAAPQIKNISAMTARNFKNITQASNQADFIIISNPILYNDGSGVNQVEQYRAYRASAVGGSHNAKIYEVAELTDQFGFGIKDHPSSLRDFILYAADNFTVKPKNVFLIGRGVSYIYNAANGQTPTYRALDLVPTFGWPASDNLLASRRGTIYPVVPIGRLAAVNGTEIKNYLEKLLTYEQLQQTSNPTIAVKGWMKNFMHVVGGKNTFENSLFTSYMNSYGDIAKDTLYGAHVETFTKSTAATVEQANSARIAQLLQEGLGMINYFGHSSASTFEFNLSSPSEYNNEGKYPFFEANGCNAGDYFTYDPARLTGELTLSEKYVLTPKRGSIGFLASTHFGLPNYLDQYNKSYYTAFAKTTYGKSVGEQMQLVSKNLGGENVNLGFFERMHLEQNSLHGDPAIKINSFAKADYVIEENLVKIDPSFVSVADNNFKLQVKYNNIGKAVGDSIKIFVKRVLPDNSLITLFDKKVAPPLNQDSLSFVIPINPLTDKGLNKIQVSLDYDNKVDELYETNNTISKDFFVFEDEIRPVFPYNLSIVNQQNFIFSASTANPLSPSRKYLLEVDTTELFNSTLKKSFSQTGAGGAIEFKSANVSFTDSTVYYWRVAIEPIGSQQIVWNSSSFIYLPQSSAGFSQSHYFQHRKSTYEDVQLGTDRKFKFDATPRNITIRTGIYPFFDFDKINVNIDFTQQELYGCKYNSIQFYVFDPNTLTMWDNYNTGGSGRFGSWPVCTFPTRKFFEFPYAVASYRKAAMDFMDSIPAGFYVGITNLGDNRNNTSFIDQWKTDQTVLGNGNSLYHKLVGAGFTQIDSFYRNIPFMYFYKKGDAASFSPIQRVGAQVSSYIDEIITVPTSKVKGTITSALYGPAKQWTALHWRGSSNDPAPAADEVKIEVYGVRNDGAKTLLKTVAPAQDTSLNFVSAAQYPYLQLKVLTKDSVYATPNQLQYLRVNAQLIAEGAVAPNIAFNAPDTVFGGADFKFTIAFKNVSPYAFDSLMRTKFIITDNNNVAHPISITPRKRILAGDTLLLSYDVPTLEYPGKNTIFIEFNPDNHQLEQYHYNNLLYKSFFVKQDLFNPTLDVTFDAVHILNEDIVSSTPHILVKLTDENRFVALKDTALLKVQVRFPGQNGIVKTYRFDGDTLRFIPANLGAGQNTATIEFNPRFFDDGTYELIVTGKDQNGNKAGDLAYSVLFKVINKAMISNMLNYPNPFTTSTAFVFTLTGNEVPQNMRIQILTITGKIVREITKDELGPIHIGRNITEFKWDGTDMYGSQLANGVYLYRVLTNLNGKTLDQYKAGGDDTDKFFNKGYGKMYLMR